MPRISFIHAANARAPSRRESLESFDLNLLRALDVLLGARSVSGAACELGSSQPATSAGLARPRDALGDPLLVRNGNRMVSTPLAAAAKFEPATTRRRFRIGANDYAALVVLTPLAARLRELAPHAALVMSRRCSMRPSSASRGPITRICRRA